MFGLTVTVDHKPHNSLWGRFGGGWQWKIGVQAGGSTIIFSLLTFSLRLDFDGRTSKAKP